MCDVPFVCPPNMHLAPQLQLQLRASLIRRELPVEATNSNSHLQNQFPFEAGLPPHLYALFTSTCTFSHILTTVLIIMEFVCSWLSLNKMFFSVNKSVHT